MKIFVFVYYTRNISQQVTVMSLESNIQWEYRSLSSDEVEYWIRIVPLWNAFMLIESGEILSLPWVLNQLSNLAKKCPIESPLSVFQHSINRLWSQCFKGKTTCMLLQRLPRRISLTILDKIYSRHWKFPISYACSIQLCLDSVIVCDAFPVNRRWTEDARMTRGPIHESIFGSVSVPRREKPRTETGNRSQTGSEL